MKRITVKAIALALGMCAAAGLSAGVQAGGTSYVASWIDTAFQNGKLFGSSVNEKKADQKSKEPSKPSQEERKFTFKQSTTTNDFDFGPMTNTYTNNQFPTYTTQQIPNTSQYTSQYGDNNKTQLFNNITPQIGSLFDNQQNQTTSQWVDNNNNINNNSFINSSKPKYDYITTTSQIENFSKELKGLEATINKVQNKLSETTLNLEKRLQSLEAKKGLVNNEAFTGGDLEKVVQDKVQTQLGSQMAGNVAIIREEVAKTLNDVLKNSDWAKDVKEDISKLFTELNKVITNVNALNNALSKNQPLPPKEDNKKVPSFGQQPKLEIKFPPATGAPKKRSDLSNKLAPLINKD